MNTLLQPWDLMRILRLGMALWLAYSAFTDKQPLLGLLAGIFALQALFNVGCCGAKNCATKTNSKRGIEETIYEEVK